jgi:hypothetical protein
MDYSKYIQMKAKASNTYKSNWQGRDASEVTLRRVNMSNKNNSTTHIGPGVECCTSSTPPPIPQSPGSGFSTNYSMNTVSQKIAGCTNCQDVIWGTSGGTNLLTCSEITTILKVPSNPVKGTNNAIPKTEVLITPSCYCADPGVVQRGVVQCSDQRNSATISGLYTGWNNQVPAPINGSKPNQVIPYSSG